MEDILTESKIKVTIKSDKNSPQRRRVHRGKILRRVVAKV